MRTSAAAVALWLLATGACLMVVARAHLRTDMAAFLPRSASVAQQALTAQVSSGAASHLILLAIAGAPPPVLAQLSRQLATRLRAAPLFSDVANGDAASFAGAAGFVWRNRYLLAPDVTAPRFTAAGLRQALTDDLGLLGTDLGAALRASLPADPTGELFTLASQLPPLSGPPGVDGVWMSGGANRALLLVRTTAPGFDLDSQQRAMTLIGTAFADARVAVPGAAAARLLRAGPGILALRIQHTTKADVTRLSALATLGVACLLLFAYRSPRLLLLGLLPVASAALAATAAVSLIFGFVHGVTLGFGVTLIGETVDYPIYLFTQTAPGHTGAQALAHIWPTLRLGAATSVAGFGAMLFSGVTGFAQLGVFSVTGLAAAACVTRFILPLLVPAGCAAPGAEILSRPARAIIARRAALRPLIAVAVLAAAAALATHRGGFWDNNLADLSPVPAADAALNTMLRHDLAVPDQRYFAVLQAADEQQALRRSESLAPVLENLRAAHDLTGFDLPSATLPSDQTQRRRQAALPDAATLAARLAQASAGLPFRAGIFAPFLAAVAAARSAPPLGAASLPPALQPRLQATLVQTAKGWTVVAPLYGVAAPGRVAGALAGALAAAPPRGVQFVDIDHESAALLRIFQSDATRLTVLGGSAILLVLWVGLGALARVARVAAPLAGAVIVTAALLTRGGARLSIFEVVGFLLIVAVGSNYCLFFARAADAAAGRRAAGAIVLANLCTVGAYGLMSLSRIPVLHDIGETVAIGTLLSLVFGAALATPAPAAA